MMIRYQGEKLITRLGYLLLPYDGIENGVSDCWLTWFFRMSGSYAAMAQRTAARDALRSRTVGDSRALTTTFRFSTTFDNLSVTCTPPMSAIPGMKKDLHSFIVSSTFLKKNASFTTFSDVWLKFLFNLPGYFGNTLDGARKCDPDTIIYFASESRNLDRDIFLKSNGYTVSDFITTPCGKKTMEYIKGLSTNGSVVNGEAVNRKCLDMFKKSRALTQRAESLPQNKYDIMGTDSVCIECASAYLYKVRESTQSDKKYYTSSFSKYSTNFDFSLAWYQVISHALLSYIASSYGPDVVIDDPALISVQNLTIPIRYCLNKAVKSAGFSSIFEADRITVKPSACMTPAEQNYIILLTLMISFQGLSLCGVNSRSVTTSLAQSHNSTLELEIPDRIRFGSHERPIFVGKSLTVQSISVAKSLKCEISNLFPVVTFQVNDMNQKDGPAYNRINTLLLWAWTRSLSRYDFAHDIGLEWLNTMESICQVVKSDLSNQQQFVSALDDIAKTPEKLHLLCKLIGKNSNGFDLSELRDKFNDVTKYSFKDNHYHAFTFINKGTIKPMGVGNGIMFMDLGLSESGSISTSGFPIPS